MGTKITADMINGEEGKQTLTNQDTSGNPPEGQATGEQIPDGIQPPPDGFGEITPDPDTKPLKYKSHEDAEKAYREAEKKIHEATTENSQLRKKMEDLERKINESIGPRDQGPRRSVYDVERERIKKETFSAAQAIPETDPEYQLKIANIWMDAQDALARVAYQEQEAARSDIQVVQTIVADAIKKAELDKIPGIEELFWAKSAKADRSLPLEDQINWTISQCKAIVEGIRGKEVGRMQQEEENRQRMEVLGRGGKPMTRVQTETVGSTIADARRSALDRRRLKR